MKMRILFPVAMLAALLLGGCANYNPILVEQLSQKNQRATELTQEMCEDFYKGATAFGEGEERAWPWLGRAREINDMNVVMRKQGAACYEAESRDLEESHVDRVLKAFKRTWLSAERVVE